MAIDFPNSPTVGQTFGVTDGASYQWTGTTWDMIHQSSDNGADVVVYVPAGTGAVSTTVKAKLDQITSVKDFGATGDGVTDDAAAIQLALDAIVTAGSGALYFPTGTYILGSLVTVSTTAQEITIYGDGPAVTILEVPATNTTGGLNLTFNDRVSVCYVSDLSILADGESLGTGLAITSVPGGNQLRRGATVSNVIVGGKEVDTDYFDYGINLKGTWRPLIQNTVVRGAWGTSVSTDYSDASYQYKMLVGINFDDAYHPELRDSYVWSAYDGVTSAAEWATLTLTGACNVTQFETVTQAVSGATGVVTQGTGSQSTLNLYDITGTFDTSNVLTGSVTGPLGSPTTDSIPSALPTPTEPEGIRISGTNIVGVRRGLVYSRTAQEPTMWVTDCHINSRDEGLFITNAKLIIIKGNSFYNVNLGGTEYAIPSDIRLDDVSAVTISQNQFHFAGAAARINIRVVGGFTSSDVMIAENIFNATADEGVAIGSDVTGAHVSDNLFPGTYTTEVDSASALTTITGGDGSAAWRLESEAVSAAVGPVYALYRNSATPAVADSLGAIHFDGNDDALTRVTYGEIKSTIVDETAGTEDATIQIFVMKAGTLTRRATFGEITINAVLPEYADNAAAVTGGLIVGDVYQTSTGEVRIRV